MKQVGLVATGDELINGDILNTNGQYLTQSFIRLGITPGQQVMVKDDTNEIEQAIRYLMRDHGAIITIGGLGPTEDDKTRYGLAQAIETELRFNETAWQWIVELLSAKDLPIPDTNRRQAMLPVGSKPIRNFNGSAAACYLSHNEQDFFMLPGPPNEFQPLLDDFVINKLTERHYATQTYRRSWLLLSVSESSVADLLEPIANQYNSCQLGYRVDYPYLEIKLVSINQTDLTRLSEEFDKRLADKLVSRQRQTCSQQLCHILKEGLQLSIHDTATHGALENCLSTPKTIKNLKFKHDADITIIGLNEFWADKTEGKTLVTMKFKEATSELNIPLRGEKTLNNAVEQICWHILLHYRQNILKSV